MKTPRTVRISAMLCPFCGSPPMMERWHGGKATKRMISCSSGECRVGPQVTGENPNQAALRWNTRATHCRPVMIEG